MEKDDDSVPISEAFATFERGELSVRNLCIKVRWRCIRLGGKMRMANIAQDLAQYSIHEDEMVSVAAEKTLVSRAGNDRYQTNSCAYCKGRKIHALSTGMG